MKKLTYLLLPLMTASFLIGCDGSRSDPPQFDTYPVMFNGNGGTLVTGEEFQLVHNPEEIVPPTYTNEPYHFMGWDVDPMYAITIMMITAQWNTGEEYIVYFNGNGGTLVEGEEKQTVTKPEDLKPPKYEKPGYVFIGWDRDLTNIYSPTTIKALWVEDNKYIVYFDCNAPDAKLEGEALQIVDDLSEIEYPESVVREGYKFAGWKEEVITERQIIYRAQWVKDDTEYNITWKWETADGPQEEIIGVKYGDTPTPPEGSEASFDIPPTRYTFAGWDSEIVEVTGEKTYTAKYNESTIKYKIKWNWENDKGPQTQESEVIHGNMPEPPAESTKDLVKLQNTYKFIGWDSEIVEATGDKTYTAEYDRNNPTKTTYTVSWYNDDKKLLDTNTAAYGETPIYTGTTTPTKAQDETHTYVFNGQWHDDKKQPLGPIEPTSINQTYAYYPEFEEYDISHCTFELNQAQSGYVLTSFNGDETTFKISPIYNNMPVVEIGTAAFALAPNLEAVIIPSSVTTINNYAFIGQTALSSITVLANNPPILKTRVFLDCENLSSIYVPSEAVEVYQEADGWKEHADIIKSII
ncbi:MAG: InlB B-repeat-containing protein [Bacilli bacterium]|nr:InlB B-repeat-containing protein [Bacilli bacterium]